MDSPSSRHRLIENPLTLILISILALLVRLPHISDSLWYDEMYTLVEYVSQPWQKVLAPQPGQYVPNNHVLHTILAKAVYSLDRSDDPTPNERLLRLPALLTGALLPLAIAWPLRKTNPKASLVLALLTTLHPWLICFADEARGYSLLLLLAVLATNLLPDGRRRWPILYALTMTAAIYTIPIAILLLAAHGITIFVTRRRATPAFLRAAALSLLLSALLYLPMARAMAQYYRQPYPTSITYHQLLDQLPRFALAGERLPRHEDPIFHSPDPPTAAVYWALPVLILVIGSALSFSQKPLLPLALSFGLATILAMLLPLLIPGATEVRFIPWAALWLCTALVAILISPQVNWARAASALAVILLLSWMALRDYLMLPNQPIRQAIHLADQLAPPGVDLMTGYLGAREAAYLYGNDAAHELLAGHDLQRWLDAEATAQSQTGRLPWVIMFYEELAFHRNTVDLITNPDTAGLWTHLQKNYSLVRRLPGRISSIGIYQPRILSNVAEAPSERSIAIR